MADQLKWNNIASGVWRLTIGDPQGPTPLSAAAAPPRREALIRLPHSGIPDVAHALKSERVGDRIVATLPLDPVERIYGLGLQFRKVNQRGRTRYLRVNSDPKQDTGETHAPVPFYVSSNGYGVLVDAPRPPTIHVGSTVRLDSSLKPVVRDRGTDSSWQATPPSDAVEIVVSGSGYSIYLFAGLSPLDAVRRYNLFCGGGCLPPRWGLGFWHRTALKYDEQQVLNEAAEYRRHDFPCDVIGLEPGWLSASYPTSYEWSKSRFPDPADFVKTMRANGFRINLWENPYLAPGSPLYPAMEKYAGSHTVWNGLAIDYTIAQARDEVKAHHDREHVSIGVSGYKIDEVDGSELTGNSWMFPGHARFPSGIDGEQMRQIFGLMVQRTTAEIFRERDQRTFGLVRASNAGGCHLPYVLYSDLYDHRDFLRALVNSSFCGLLWTPEVRQAASPEDWVRRMQAVCLSPLAMLDAWSSTDLPWSLPDVASIVRDAINLRMRLIPYLYTAFARYCFDGIPPVRALALEGAPSREVASRSPDPDLTLHAYGLLENSDSDDQWMLGQDILVAPFFAGQTSRSVTLPPGTWFAFESGDPVDGGTQFEIAGGLDYVPMFVRDGGIVPLMPACASVPAADKPVSLEVRYYGTAPGQFALYDDDGETFAYERGEYRWLNLSAHTDEDGVMCEAMQRPSDEWRSWYGRIIWRQMTQRKRLEADCAADNFGATAGAAR